MFLLDWGHSAAAVGQTQETDVGLMNVFLLDETLPKNKPAHCPATGTPAIDSSATELHLNQWRVTQY